MSTAKPLPASGCPTCQRVATPPEPTCRACSGQTDPRHLPAHGDVLTKTRIGQHWVALVELEGGARLLAEAEEEPTIGQGYALAEDPEAGYRLDEEARRGEASRS